MEGRKQRHALINCFLSTLPSQHPSLSPAVLPARQAGELQADWIFRLSVRWPSWMPLFYYSQAHTSQVCKSWVQSREWSLSTGQRMQDGHRYTSKTRTSWVATWQEEIQETLLSAMENDCLSLNDRLQINFNISTTYGYTANVICTQPGASVCIFGTSPWKLSFLLAVGFTSPCWWVTLALHTKDLVRNHMPSFIK